MQQKRFLAQEIASIPVQGFLSRKVKQTSADKAKICSCACGTLNLRLLGEAAFSLRCLRGFLLAWQRKTQRPMGHCCMVHSVLSDI